MKYKCLKFTKIVGEKGVYIFKGGVFETENNEQIAELENNNDVEKVGDTKKGEGK